MPTGCYASATCYHAACLSVCHIRSSNVAHHIYVCLSIFCVRMLPIQLNARLSFCYMFVYISLYTCLSARLYVRNATGV